MGTAASIKDDRHSSVVETNESKDVEFRQITCGCSSLDHASDVDKFSKEIFARSSKIEGLHRVFASESGRDSFMTFLRKEYAKENLWFFMAVDEMRSEGSRDDETCNEDAKYLIKNYLLPDSVSKVNVSDQLRQSVALIASGKKRVTTAQMLGTLYEAQDEALMLVAIGALPCYLSSNYYAEWHAIELIEAQDKSLRDFMEIRQFKMSKVLDQVLVSSSWLRELMSGIEFLPVCISLASASLRGFPLIYVNAAFEETTGYDRSEIVGQNCRFLQTGKNRGEVSETDSILKLGFALREAKPVKVAITNYRKDGTPFHNLLAMKPILNQDGGYAFVLGIQFDIGDKNSCARKLKIVDELFQLLPDTVFADFDV